MVVDSEVEDRVAILDNLRLEDDQPNIEAPAVSISCDTNMAFSFQDRNAYDTHWIDETLAMEKLVRNKLDSLCFSLWGRKSQGYWGVAGGRVSLVVGI
jgi:hypothetical protein